MKYSEMNNKELIEKKNLYHGTLDSTYKELEKINEILTDRAVKKATRNLKPGFEDCMPTKQYPKPYLVKG